MSKILSILIPVKNEIHYLPDLLKELVDLDECIEIVISDNYSDDGTWEYLCGLDSNIVVVRPPVSCSPFDNYKHSLSKATGKYIFPMGGDDIILSKSLNEIICILKKYDNIILVGRLSVFSDRDPKYHQISNKRKTIESFFDRGVFSIKKYIKYINYDELVFSFVPRNKQNFVFNLHASSYERVAVWSNFYNFYDQKRSNIFFSSDVVLMKRVGKTLPSGNFNKDQRLDSNVRNFIGTLTNSYNFMKVHFDLRVLVYFLLHNRQAVGAYGHKKVYSPFIRFVGSEALNFVRKYFNIRRKESFSNKL